MLDPNEQIDRFYSEDETGRVTIDQMMKFIRGARRFEQVDEETGAVIICYEKSGLVLVYDVVTPPDGDNA